MECQRRMNNSKTRNPEAAPLFAAFHFWMLHPEKEARYVSLMAALKDFELKHRLKLAMPAPSLTALPKKPL
jgi:hypothetical protein